MFDPDFVEDDRAVQWTLEAFLAGLVLLTAVVLVADITTTTGEDSTERISETQLSQRAADVLTFAEQNNSLKDTILYWNSSRKEYINTSANITGDNQYISLYGDSTPLSNLVSDTLGEGPFAYNILLSYNSGPVLSEERYLVYQGSPSDSGVRASVTIPLDFDDKPAQTPNDCTLEEMESNSGECVNEAFYIPDSDSKTEYNRVRVVLEVWRL
jgi:hypothetical protein